MKTKTSTQLSLLSAVCAAGFLFIAPRLAHAGNAEKSETVAAIGVVNLNTATEDQLTELPGVGPSKAQAIVQYRVKRGKFKAVDELTRVKGFGRKTLQKLKPYLSITGTSNFRGQKTTHGDEAKVNLTPPELPQP